MKTKTKALLEFLDRATLFTAVGKAIPDAMKNFVVAACSWAEALACCTSVEWENYSLEQHNGLTMYLHAYAIDEYRNWNRISAGVKKVSEPIVRKKAALLSQLDSAAKQAVTAALNWDIFGACMELEYAHVRKPSFFGWLIEFYLLGRFPCGWGDRNENGRIILYQPLEEGDYDPNEPDFQKLVIAEQNRLYHHRIRMPAVGKLVIY